MPKTRKKNQTVIRNVIFNGIEYKSNITIASHFNNYFLDSIMEIRNLIENVQYINNVIIGNQKLKFRAMSILELKIVKRLNVKPDYSKIWKKIIIDN